MRLRAGQVDLERGVIVREGRTVRLTPLEVRLLAYLADHPDRDISQEELLQQVWGYAPGVASRAVTATVHRLRVKIERDPAEPDHLLTVWAKGLRFELATIPSPTLGPPDRFVGREALLERVSSDLEQRRLVTLTGPGGIGKTRLAQQLGRSSPQPQLWVDATQARSATDLVREVAGALSLRASSATEGATRVGHALQARGPLRLVLDNLEGALDAAAQLLPGWLAEASDCTVLVTSREALRIAGEAAHAVGPLEAHAAAELFEERLPRGVTVDPSVRDDVLQPLDGWPLAIELAARLADVLPPSELARRLGAADGASSALSLLHADRRDRPQRHHSLYSVLQGSVDAVPPSAQRALTTLAVLRGPFGPSDVSALLGDTGWRDLRVLVHHSLVTRHARGHRLLEPVRAYALEALRRSPHQRAVHHAVHRFVVDAAQQRFDPAGGPPSRADLAWAHDHAADLRAAWERACRSDASQAGILAAALHVLYVNGGPLSQSVRVLEHTLQLSSLPPRLEGHLQRHMATARHHTDDVEGAEEAAHRALAIAEAQGDRVLEGRTCTLLLSLEVAARRPASDWAQRALDAHHAAGDEAALASTLGTLGGRHWFSHRFDEAAATYERAVRLHRTHGNERNAAVAMGNLAMVQSERGRHGEAQDLLQQALALHRAHGDRVHEATTLVHLGMLALKEQRYDDAAATLGEADRLARASGQGPRRIAHAAYLRGAALALHGRLAEARTALASSRLWADRAALAFPLQRQLQAWVQAHSGRPEDALQLLQLHPATPTAREERVSGVLRGLLLTTLGQQGLLDRAHAETEARQLLRSARRAFRRELPISEGWRYLERLEHTLHAP